jgi:hypothetical protein
MIFDVDLIFNLPVRLSPGLVDLLAIETIDAIINKAMEAHPQQIARPDAQSHINLPIYTDKPRATIHTVQVKGIAYTLVLVSKLIPTSGANVLLFNTSAYTVEEYGV